MDIALICTDFHIKTDNLASIIDLHKQAIIEANSRGIDDHIWLGDVFESRVSQREEVLNGLTSIIELYNQAGHTIHCIPGNHDKTDYDSVDSFLTSFKHHPSFDLITTAQPRCIPGGRSQDPNYRTCYFIPFFNENIWMEEFEKVKEDSFDVVKPLLFSHIAVQGSVNNDGTKVQSTLKPSLFKKFEKVYLGHYHDYQEISPNIVHLGSLQQNNFGENEDKGFWILSLDGEVDLVPSKGTSFKKLQIDLDNTSQKQAVAIIQKFEETNPGCRLRVELTGESASIKAFDSAEFKSKGIDIKRKFKEVEVMDDTEVTEVKSSTFDEVKSKFEIFCKENDYEYAEGIKILEEAMR